jgi:hypothetical protein
MTTLNDIPGAYERLTAAADALAAKLGVDRSVIYGYFNKTAHFPTSIEELNTFGNKVDPTYGVRRRQDNGNWTSIMPGVTPGKSPTDPGFSHRIANAEDSQIERFQQVNADGTLFGGSWDAAVNAQHPEWNGQNGFQTSGALATALTRGAQEGSQAQQFSKARSFDGSNYVAPNPSGTGFVSVVDGIPVERNTKEEAEQDFNRRTTAAAPPAPAAPAAPSTTAPSPTTPPTTTTTTPSSSVPSLPPGSDPRTMTADQLRALGYGALLDGIGYSNTQKYLMEKELNDARVKDLLDRLKLAQNDDERAAILQDFNIQAARDARYDKNRAGDLDRWSSLAQNLLTNATELGSRPEDYFKYNKYLSGGRDIYQQMMEGTPAQGGAPTGEIKAGSISNLLNQLGINSAPNLPFQPANPDPRVNASAQVARIKASYAQAIKAAGVGYFSANDPRLLAIFKTAGELDDAGAAEVARRNADYFQANKVVVPDDVMAGYIAEAKQRRASAPAPTPSPVAQGLTQGAQGVNEPMRQQIKSGEIDWRDPNKQFARASGF